MSRVLNIIQVKLAVQIAVQRIGETVRTFQLKRGMRNIITVKDHFTDLTLNVRTRADV